MNIFEIAIRNKMRFPFKGLVTAEDLWDLSVKDLDAIFKTLNSQVKKVNEESLLDTKSSKDETLDTMIEIIKYIVSVKLDEEKVRLLAKDQREKKQKIMAILSDKQDSDLQNKSIDELKSMLDELGK